MGRRKGVRKFFHRPPKGCKLYGRTKHMKKPKVNGDAVFDVDCAGTASQHLPQHSDGVSLESHPLIESPPLSDAFCGFNISEKERDDGSSKVKLRVLSLFDGISTGYYTLRCKLNLDVENYFSSEICPDALRVQQQNFQHNITRLGSVCDLTLDKIDDLGPIHLLIGGSPCNDLSLVNPKRKGLLDKSGTGPLFFDYVRIMKHLRAKAEQNGQKFYWLYENTFRMRTVDLNIMIESLGSTPACINAARFVPMERKRNFWGNIPGLYEIPSMEGQAVPPLDHFCRPYRVAVSQTLRTLTTSCNSQRAGNKLTHPVLEDNEPSFLWPNEIESLFGLPENYTDYGLSMTKRQRLLGKAWSVHVLIEILKPLTSFFKVTHRKELQFEKYKHC